MAIPSLALAFTRGTLAPLVLVYVVAHLLSQSALCLTRDGAFDGQVGRSDLPCTSFVYLYSWMDGAHDHMLPLHIPPGVLTVEPRPRQKKASLWFFCLLFLPCDQSSPPVTISSCSCTCRAGCSIEIVQDLLERSICQNKRSRTLSVLAASTRLHDKLNKGNEVTTFVYNRDIVANR